MPSPIQIKRSDVAEQIRALAELTGESITDAIARAVRAQLEIERAKARARLTKRRIAAQRGLARLHSLPVVGPIVSDQDLYDGTGLPK